MRPLVLTALTAMACGIALALPVAAPTLSRPMLMPVAVRAGNVASDVSLLTRQGVETTGAAAWHLAGFTGQGVRVGILDLGFAGYRDLLGDALPSEVIAESFVPGQSPDGGGQAHGTACAEIVHAMAPGAALYLAYYDGSEASMSRAVRWLIEQGVDVISHSATFAVGPMDGTGAQCDLVASAARRGVLWVNSTGNYGRSHYRGQYLDADADGWHEFPNGDERMAIRAQETGILVSLNWDDWGDAGQDYDLLLVDANGATIASSASSQKGGSGDLPFEAISYLPGSAGGVYYVSIQGSHISPGATLDFYALNAEIDFPTAPYSLGTPADSPLALSVGAINWQSQHLEDFSSQGPSNDDRIKPDIVGPDGVGVAVYAPRPFYGTSAAAPHVAGAAALVLSAHPDYTREQVIDLLTAAARDLGEPGLDSAYGFGALLLPEP